MKTTTVTCNFCNKDLTTTKDIKDFRLCLTAEDKTQIGPKIEDLTLPEGFKEPMHFCDFKCLAGWTSKLFK